MREKLASGTSIATCPPAAMSGHDELAVLIVPATGSDIGRICFTYGVVEAVRRDLARPILASV